MANKNDNYSVNIQLSNNMLNLVLLLLVFFLIDLYAFRLLFRWHKQRRPTARGKRVYWLLSVVVYLLILISNLYGQGNVDPFIRNLIIGYSGMLFFTKIVTIPFLLIDDVLGFVVWSWRKISGSNEKKKIISDPAQGITRSEFISRLAILTAGIPFLSLGYGMLNGAYNYQVRNVRLRFPNLPKAFHGIKIVQLSDIHSGSFGNKSAVESGIQLVLDQKPDYIFFTGDLVNNQTKEVEPWITTFSKLKAPGGVFSILGNHDYGDYFSWPDEAAKKENLNAMHEAHAKIGWRLLRNESVTLERDGDKIGLIGVENWGARGRFSQYGNLKKAAANSRENPFNILLSHDPSHFEAEVQQKKPEIDLTLSGHTHGMQFGVEIPGYIKWSPASWIYPYWAGLYSFGKQHLYVNRGFGFIGYPGRVGILPEITVITLETEATA